MDICLPNPKKAVYENSEVVQKVVMNSCSTRQLFAHCSFSGGYRCYNIVSVGNSTQKTLGMSVWTCIIHRQL